MDENENEVELNLTHEQKALDNLAVGTMTMIVGVVAQYGIGKLYERVMTARRLSALEETDNDEN